MNVCFSSSHPAEDEEIEEVHDSQNNEHHADFYIIRAERLRLHLGAHAKNMKRPEVKAFCNEDHCLLGTDGAYYG